MGWWSRRAGPKLLLPLHQPPPILSFHFSLAQSQLMDIVFWKGIVLLTLPRVDSVQDECWVSRQLLLTSSRQLSHLNISVTAAASSFSCSLKPSQLKHCSLSPMTAVAFVQFQKWGLAILGVCYVGLISCIRFVSFDRSSYSDSVLLYIQQRQLFEILIISANLLSFSFWKLNAYW